MTSRLRDGVEYTCLPFSGRIFPTDAADTNGQICAWSEGSDIAAVMDARTSDVDAAVTDSAAAHASLAGSG